VTPQDARAEITRVEAVYDALPQDAPRQVRQEARYALELAIQDYHYWMSVERRKRQGETHVNAG
jgi:hypothetical protein